MLKEIIGFSTAIVVEAVIALILIIKTILHRKTENDVNTMSIYILSLITAFVLLAFTIYLFSQSIVFLPVKDV